jgi:predicted transcriptional regulator
VAILKYVGMRVTNQNCNYEEIRSKLVNSRNACYHAVQNLLFSRLVTKKRKD